MKAKGKSAIFFIISVLIIGLLAYTGIYGVQIGGYRFKPFSETINKGLDLQGGVSVLEEVQGNNVDQKTIDRTIELLSMRVNKLGVSETTVTREGAKRIRIDIPGKFDTKEVIDSVTKTGELKFMGPDKSVILTGKDVKDATSYMDDTNQPTIGLELNDSGTKKFADATQKFYGQQITIYMDNDKLEDAKVAAVITNGKAVITGSSSLEEAKNKASIIKSGALPVVLKTQSASVVGPTLGAESIPQSLTAAKVGIGLVFLFMILYYRVPGFLACIALTLYVIILLGAFSAVNVTLTLSGITAVLLTIGMAVDANILIFERMKEELKAGKSVKSAVNAGFHRAMSSILDSNITTIIAGIVLYGLGSGSVKGFALTLIIGVILSMFTAITVSKHLIQWAANMGWLTKKTIGTFGVHDIAQRR